MGVPFVAFSGYSVGSLRFSHFDKHIELSNPFMVELKARRLISVAVHQSQLNSGVNRKEGSGYAMQSAANSSSLILSDRVRVSIGSLLLSLL